MPAIELKSPTVFQRVLIIFISLLIATAALTGAKLLFSGSSMTFFAGTRPTNIGVYSGQLASCPNTPNCVNSQSQDVKHKIEPFTYNSSSEKAMADLKTVMKSFKQSKIITETKNYLYAEFTIPIIGFVDDVEFYLDENAKVIHIRSASRLGESDLGVNRKRIETIRTRLNELKNNTSA
jgi:uncharacterized protein (DUF1499 family)